MNSWLIEEIISEQRQGQLDSMSPHRLAALAEHEGHDRGVRRALASALIRIGTTLDSEAASRVALARTGTRS